jgi:hypothetical protein
VRDLRRLIASNGHLPIDNLSLILRGTALCDLKNGDDVHIQLNDGGIVLILIFLLMNSPTFLYHSHLKGATLSMM